MAVTVNSVTKSGGSPAAYLQAVEVDIDGDISYPTGGYDVSGDAAWPKGAAVVQSDFVPNYDGAELRWARLEGAGMVVFYDTANAAPSTETTATDDMSGHTGVRVGAILK